VPIDADEITQVGREAGTDEVPPLAAFETPVLVLGEVDIQRDLRALFSRGLMRASAVRATAQPVTFRGLGRYRGELTTAEFVSGCHQPGAPEHAALGQTPYDC
jgi:hypothetical protein